MRSSRSLAATFAALTVLALLATGTAEAHHPMGGQTPQTFWHGFLSGIGHPVIGPDHLAFIVAIGMAAGLVGTGGLGLAATFIAASSAGVLVHVAKLDLPMAEPLVALSVIVAGALLFIDPKGRQSMWLGLAAVAGLLHGYAFGEAVVGAERTVVGAYLVGIAVITTLIAWSFKYLTQQLADTQIASARLVRVTACAVGCAGLVMLAATVIAA